MFLRENKIGKENKILVEHFLIATPPLVCVYDAGRRGYYISLKSEEPGDHNFAYLLQTNIA